MTWQTIGFDKIKKSFSSLNKQKKLGHAYLFAGQDMIGKRTFALELVKKINLLDESLDHHPDIFYIDDQPTISIEKIRDLKKFMSFKPYSAPYKFVIIDNAHTMTPEAGNSILKILEEPSPNSILILITSQLHQMLPTVTSRCEIVNFAPHPDPTLREYLKKLSLNEKQIDFFIPFSNGRIGLAVNLYKDNSFSLIRKIIEDFRKITKSPVYKKFDYISKLLNNDFSYDSKTALLYWMLYLRSPLSDNMNISKMKALKKISKLYYHIQQPQLNHKLLFENTLLNI